VKFFSAVYMEFSAFSTLASFRAHKKYTSLLGPFLPCRFWQLDTFIQFQNKTYTVLHMCFNSIW